MQNGIVLKMEGKDRRGVVQPFKKTFLNDVPQKTGQGVHGIKYIDTPAYQKLVERVFEYLKEGIPSNAILQTLMMEDPKMTEYKFVKLLQYAYRYSEIALQKDREYVFQLHMERYEDIFRECLTMLDSSFRPLDPHKDWIKIVGRYRAAMSALKAKEDLLGLHDKSMVLEFNEHKAIVVEREDLRTNSSTPIAGYNLDRLSEEELFELVELIKKIRTIPIDGVQRIVVKQTKIQIDVNGERIVEKVENVISEITKIRFEDMPADVVGRFEDVTKPLDEIYLPLPEKNVIDSVPKEYRKIPRKTEVDLREKLRLKALEVKR